MIYIILAFFSLAAILGIFLLTYVLGSKNTPKGVAIIHGTFAATAWVLLIIYAFFKTPSPFESTILFIIAALMGFILIFKDIMGKQVPKWLALAHGLTAVTAFLFLLLHLFSEYITL